jgi:surface antigen
MSIRMLIRSILIGIAFIGLHVLTTLAADPPNPYAARFRGECTWYAAERRPDLRFNTGHAYEWADAARARGYVVDTNPEVGAIAVWGTRGW